ncbi:hypothetical protein J2Z48_002953 [Croceifilum oryzae]|uniref:Uncharacterized protein n=1 Tax=Croceifilum oryzae TaxID=1553429 RepID=A0AAJ1THT1_9BACL|nr:hypothetical protein [Croceifilum oryzae]MDQ0418749.1 hypothetical protein [Croceifilum oryzae]
MNKKKYVMLEFDEETGRVDIELGNMHVKNPDDIFMIHQAMKEYTERTERLLKVLIQMDNIKAPQQNLQ